MEGTYSITMLKYLFWSTVKCIFCFRIDAKDKSFAIISEVFVEMKKDNVISPYIFKKVIAEK